MPKKSFERNEQIALLEAFLSIAGLDTLSIKEVVSFARQIKGLSWKVRGRKLKLVVDGVEVEGLELDAHELKALGKEEALEKVLITFEKAGEIEPKNLLNPEILW